MKNIYLVRVSSNHVEDFQQPSGRLPGLSSRDASAL